MGRLGQDPEIRVYKEGSEDAFTVATFSVAVDRPKRQGSDEVITDWIPCKALGKRAEFAEKYIKKGMKILVEGRMQVDSWNDEQGNKKYSTYVLVSSLEFCEGKSTGTNAPTEKDEKPATDKDGFMKIPDNIEDELPFA